MLMRYIVLANTDVMKMVPVEILYNFGNIFLYNNQDFQNFFCVFFITKYAT